MWPEASRQAGRIEGMPAPMVGPRAPVSASQAPVVLVAEDTPDLQDLLMEVLISEGYSVIAAVDGVETLEALRHHRVDVLVLDLMMPRLTGWDVLRRLPEVASAPPRVIVMSAAHDLRGVQHDALVEATVRKPFDLEHLLTLVSKAAQRW